MRICRKPGWLSATIVMVVAAVFILASCASRRGSSAKPERKVAVANREIRDVTQTGPDKQRVAEEVAKPSDQMTTEIAHEVQDPVANMRKAILEGQFGQAPINEVVEQFLDAEGGTLESLYLALALRKKEALPVLMDKLESGAPHHQRKVTKLLRYLGWPEAVPVLVEVASSGEQHWLARVGSMYALGAIGDRSVAKNLAGLLDDLDRSPMEKRIIIITLARLGSGDAIPAIRPYLKHEDLLVGIYAARALAELGEEPDVAELIEASHAEDYVIRQEAAGALGSFSNPMALQRLSQLTEEDPILPVRREAKIAQLRRQLSKVSDAQRVDILKPLLADTDKQVVNWVVGALATSCGTPGRKVLEGIATDITPAGRKAAFYLMILPGASANFHGVD